MAAISKTSADVRPLPGAVVVQGTAGEALNLGDVVYLDGTAGAYKKADRGAANTAQAKGIVVSAPDGATSAASGDAIDVVVFGPVTGFSGMTPGALLYVGTAGALDDAAPAAASGQYKFIVGWARDASTVFVQPFTDDFAAQ